MGMLLMLGDLDLIVETDPENAFTRRMRKGLGGGATVRRRPTGELPTSASGTSERPIPLGLYLKCRVIRKNADRTSCATVGELPASTLWWYRAGGVVSDRVKRQARNFASEGDPCGSSLDERARHSR